MNVTWINEGTSRSTGAFMTLRSHREPHGAVRLNLYFSAHAAATLGLRRGERLLVGLDDKGTRLVFKPTLYGGNVIKGREVDDALQCVVTLPIQNLPKPQAVRESDVQMNTDHVQIPFEFDCQAFAGWPNRAKLQVVA